MNDYSFSVNPNELAVALDCEADRAASEGFKGVEKRQRADAEHIRNAVHHMGKLRPEGYRIETEIVFRLVPDVNPVARAEYRR
jgi:aspartate aminotransferase-like enzyme